LGQWNKLDSLNVKDKAAAISYVILRRALRGTSHGHHSVMQTILARDQFTGVTLKEPHSGEFKGKPEVHAALASLDSAYYREMVTYGQTHHIEYMKDILHLLSSDTSHSDDAAQFQRALRAAEAGADGALDGKEPDRTQGALFFGGVADISKSADHKPSHLVTYAGGLGPYTTVKALLADPQIHSASHRLELRDGKGVDAIFFFK